MAPTDFISVIVIAFGLSADCFAVALGGSCAMKNVSPLQILRASASFGLFQTLMPLTGWLAGRAVEGFMSDLDHWIALVLLAFVGVKMIWEAMRHEGGREYVDITRGWTLVTLSIATSIDALAVGLSLAFLDINIGLSAVIIGVIAFFISILGFIIGRRVGKLAGRWAEAIGGIFLIGIGLRIFLTHIL